MRACISNGRRMDNYQHAIWGNGSDFPSSVSDSKELSSAIKENIEFRTYVANIASGLQPGESIELIDDDGLEFKDGDLHYVRADFTTTNTDEEPELV